MAIDAVLRARLVADLKLGPDGKPATMVAARTGAAAPGVREQAFERTT